MFGLDEKTLASLREAESLSLREPVDTAEEVRAYWHSEAMRWEREQEDRARHEGHDVFTWAGEVVCRTCGDVPEFPTLEGGL